MGRGQRSNKGRHTCNFLFKLFYFSLTGVGVKTQKCRNYRTPTKDYSCTPRVCWGILWLYLKNISRNKATLP